MNAKTLWLVTPAILVPLLGFVGWGLTRLHRPGRSTGLPGAHGFNVVLPNALLPGARHKDKLEMYLQAERDSARLRADEEPTVKPDSDANEQKVYRSIARLEAVWNAPRRPTRDIAPLPPPPPPPPLRRQDSPEPSAPDPEIQQLSTMLDKILYIQHPDAFLSTRVQTTAPAKEYFLADSDQAIEAVTVSDQTLISGETVSLRLLTDIRTKRGVLPRNTEVSGIASLDGERLHIKVENALFDNRMYPLGLEAYDLDGRQGVYVPGSLTRDAARQSADQALNAVGPGLMDPSVGAQATNAALQSVKTLLSRKVKEPRITLRAGYLLILR